MVSRDKNGFSGFTCLLFISLGVHILGYVNKSFYNKQWDYFGFLEEKVPKCYLSGSDF